MPHFLIEQTFAAPLAEGLEAFSGAARDSRLERSFLSRDGQRHIGLYQAESADNLYPSGIETVASESRAYPVHAIVHSLPERPAGHSLVVAQRDLSGVPGVSVEMAQYLSSDPLGCGQRLRLTHIGAYLAHDLQRMVCVYFAPDMESVRKANRENGVPWEHLWRGEIMHPR